MRIYSQPYWLKLPALYLSIVLLCCTGGGLRGESAQYSFEGTLRGELPLEEEFLSLARKHGLDVQAIVSGTLSVRTNKALFSSTETSSVELKLIFGEIQELSAHLKTDGFKHAVGSPKAGPTTVRFDLENILVSNPDAFPARIGLPSTSGQNTAFVLNGIQLLVDPQMLAGSANQGEGLGDPFVTLVGTLFLRQEGGKEDGRGAELNITVTDLKRAEIHLADSREWRSVALAMENMALGNDLDDSWIFNDLPGGGGDDGGLILIPEPSAFGLLLGFAVSALALFRHRRHDPIAA